MKKIIIGLVALGIVAGCACWSGERETTKSQKIAGLGEVIHSDKWTTGNILFINSGLLNSQTAVLDAVVIAAIGQVINVTNLQTIYIQLDSNYSAQVQLYKNLVRLTVLKEDQRMTMEILK